jgi:hypothetical protein
MHFSNLVENQTWSAAEHHWHAITMDGSYLALYIDEALPNKVVLDLATMTLIID